MALLDLGATCLNPRYSIGEGTGCSEHPHVYDFLSRTGAVFPLDISEYEKIVPGPNIRTALSGCLGRLFWEMASSAIWVAMKDEDDV